MPLPTFVAVDAAATVQDLIAEFERQTGRALFPGQYERLLVNLIGYEGLLLKAAIQDTGEQNLVEYARGVNLENLGRLLGVTRLPAQPARTTMLITLESPAPVPITVPSGLRIAAVDGPVFATVDSRVIPTGGLTTTVAALAVEAGDAGNGYAPGTVTTVIDSLPSGLGYSATNQTPADGGAATEDDENLRERILLAPESFSNAGSVGAYEFWARSASQEVIDAAVRGVSLSEDPLPGEPTPGEVWIYPLTRSGLPTPEVKALVAASVSAEKVRPLTDWVQIKDPVRVPYAITLSAVLSAGADAETVKGQIEGALLVLTNEWRSRLGARVALSQVICAAQDFEGVVSVSLASPNADLVLDRWQWADCTGIAVTVA